METLVATVLIVLVFMISTFVLNSLFTNTVRQHTDALQTRIAELSYLSIHKQIAIPYDDAFENWDITVARDGTTLLFEAVHKETGKVIRTQRYE
jgi:hypothetical protein